MLSGVTAAEPLPQLERGLYRHLEMLEMRPELTSRHWQHNVENTPPGFCDSFRSSSWSLEFDKRKWSAGTVSHPHQPVDSKCRTCTAKQAASSADRASERLPSVPGQIGRCRRAGMRRAACSWPVVFEKTQQVCVAQQR